MNYDTHTLPSGMRMVYVPSASPVIYCGIGIEAGTRNELPGQEGLAHFLEHLTFKGTRRRSAVQIINAIEGVGGDLNAFTNKEHTMFHAAVLRDHLPRALDVLTDIVFCSEYPEEEIAKEVEVVCDEIESYEDSPAELIYDEFENVLFSGHPLGHSILGTASQLRTYTRADVLAFARRWYRPEHAVFFLSGDADFGKVVRRLERLVPPAPALPAALLGGTASGSKTPQAATVSGGSYHQSHVILGRKAYAVGDDRRWALYLLSNILGGPGMNSRLNMSLRERHGLVYGVESSMVSYSDTGLWAVYFACDAHDRDRCMWLVRRELDRLMTTPLSETQLKAAKRQLAGQLAISSDNREQFALDVAKSFLHSGKPRDLSHVLAHVEQLTAQQLQAVAREMFAPEGISTLVYK